MLNEPNLVEQANKTPQQAAAFWPGYERIAAETGVKIVGPQITWGTMAGYGDPVVWMDAFYAAYRAANGGRDPRIDYLGFHWYDYGLAGQLDRLVPGRRGGDERDVCSAPRRALQAGRDELGSIRARGVDAALPGELDTTRVGIGPDDGASGRLGELQCEMPHEPEPEAPGFVQVPWDAVDAWY